MSDTNANDDVPSMPAADVSFLIACLQNTTGGSIQIDHKKVAAVRGMANPRSVSNRISTLKKKYNLPFGAATGGSKAADGNGAKQPAANGAAVKTPASKKRPAKVATPKKPAKKAKEEEEVKAKVEEEDGFEDAEEGHEGDFEEDDEEDAEAEDNLRSAS